MLPVVFGETVTLEVLATSAVLVKPSDKLDVVLPVAIGVRLIELWSYHLYIRNIRDSVSG